MGAVTVKVLILATGVDTGGQGYRISEAFRKNEPDWQVDSVNTTRHPFAYTEQHTVGVRERMRLVGRLYQDADVIHLRDHLVGWHKHDAGRKGKPTVLHHHGSFFRKNHGAIANQSRRLGIVEIASTIDLTLLEPNVEWVPSPYDLHQLGLIRAIEYGPSENLRIAHFPTSLTTKQTASFMAALAGISEKRKVETITNLDARGRAVHMPHVEVLHQKARADIYLDQLVLGYGNASIEAWGMGIPVVAGVADPKVRKAMIERWGELPFVEASEENVAAVLAKLVRSPSMRKEYGERGRAHAQRFHSEASVVDVLKGIYENAPRTRSAVITPRTPRHFLKVHAA